MLVLNLHLKHFAESAPQHLAGGDLDPEELHPLIWGSVLVLLKSVGDVVLAQRAGRASVPVQNTVCAAAAQLTRAKGTLEAASVTWHIEIAVLKSVYKGKIQPLLKGKLAAGFLQQMFRESIQGLCCYYTPEASYHTERGTARAG